MDVTVAFILAYSLILIIVINIIIFLLLIHQFRFLLNIIIGLLQALDESI